ncbi:colanic acid biosynthesis glycosyltransferase WcaI [Chitinophaga silvatica]|uniref:Colanic acid biosynthesis glycosyltransferase WcaI n=1 Tax=Chitinophaga silvatica TaxID=2282649 RepID=A0A3E1Y4W9_9BACT|nr:WcaI family glycosyltransferase [Chitinophaga silvatica]RFS19672.1 colanic acid biosynthesis glycosyltransferase WcaI [Chitinophaga silvatica]
MNKRILLISPNFSPEATGIGKFNGELIAALAEKGFECSVITTYPYYPEQNDFISYNAKRYWFSKESFSSAIIYRCPQYVPKHSTAIKRIFQELTFLFTAFIQLLQLLPGRRFTYVITIAPPFHTGLLAVFYKWCKKTTAIYHIQDLQIEIAKTFQLIRSHKLLNLLWAVEKFIIKQSDHISSISPGMINKIKTKTSKEIYYFPNWVNTSIFFPIADKEKLKTNFGFNTGDKIVLYAGAIAEKQGIDILLSVAKQMECYKYIRFVICGAGTQLNRLKAGASDNMFFLPIQPLNTFNELLNMADLHLVLQREEMNHLVLPSKLTAILAVGGLAVVTATEGSELHTMISNHSIGMLADAGSVTSLHKVILEALQYPDTEIAKRARRFAESNLSTNHIINNFCTDLLNTTAKTVLA